MDLLEPPAEATHVVDASGDLYSWQIRPDLMVQRISGNLTLPLARAAGEFLEPRFAGAKCTLFVDNERLTHYTREAREHLSAFSVERLSSIDAIHFLISSKVVALGLSTFKDDIGSERFRVYTDRASFEKSFAEAVAAS
jgi:hypothetical protein